MCSTCSSSVAAAAALAAAIAAAILACGVRQAYYAPAAAYVIVQDHRSDLAPLAHCDSSSSSRKSEQQ